jgi:hypothetical protein
MLLFAQLAHIMLGAPRLVARRSCAVLLALSACPAGLLSGQPMACAASASTDRGTSDLRGPQLARQRWIVVSMKDDCERIFEFE